MRKHEYQSARSKATQLKIKSHTAQWRKPYSAKAKVLQREAEAEGELEVQRAGLVDGLHEAAVVEVVGKPRFEVNTHASGELVKCTDRSIYRPIKRVVTQASTCRNRFLALKYEAGNGTGIERFFKHTPGGNIKFKELIFKQMRTKFQRHSKHMHALARIIVRRFAPGHKFRNKAAVLEPTLDIKTLAEIARKAKSQSHWLIEASVGLHTAVVVLKQHCRKMLRSRASGSW